MDTLVTNDNDTLTMNDDSTFELNGTGRLTLVPGIVPPPPPEFIP
jgi:hypothetical protein